MFHWAANVWSQLLFCSCSWICWSNQYFVSASQSWHPCWFVRLFQHVYKNHPCQREKRILQDNKVLSWVRCSPLFWNWQRNCPLIFLKQLSRIGSHSSESLECAALLIWQCQQHVGDTSATCQKIAKFGLTCVLVPNTRILPWKSPTNYRYCSTYRCCSTHPKGWKYCR